MSQSLREIKVEKTKKLIKETLLDLIEEKGFEAISVRDITLKAGLNRGTFYLHYRDKYDLMEKSQNEILEGLQDRLIFIRPKEMNEFYSNDIVYPPILNVYHYLKENQRLIKILISTKGDPAFQKKMKEHIKETIYEKLVDLLEEEYMIEIPHEYTTAFISSAFFGLMEQWLEKEEPITPEEMAIMHMKLLKFMKKFVSQIAK
ncbi:TetR family transcriptional regulator [Bacillus sp. AFS077874]|uniref:TetR/AcrR family transcriptional regulator n=1 Tax=unclassified Bacillus (in: firmicutes) TaxID=185979 RepID=UPI000BEBF8A4|nr:MULTISPECIES: TetR/AcrR family transcriptional regulator [unclassified Bacillus (in: firmicutes)]PEC49286.1 TetR family transcriptional regulator [Bacillus sp. AFS096315]PFM82469.1 TetR family transcriptional regulator [Bacillus sp. AFS077874]